MLPRIRYGTFPTPRNENSSGKRIRFVRLSRNLGTAQIFHALDISTSLLCHTQVTENVVYGTPFLGRHCKTVYETLLVTAEDAGMHVALLLLVLFPFSAKRVSLFQVRWWSVFHELKGAAAH